MPFGAVLEFGRLRRLAAMFLEFGLVQAAVQGLGFVTGILVVRLLAVDQYALYTIANTMMSTLYLLAESGIASAAVGIGGRAWQDPDWLGRTVRSTVSVANRLRNLVAAPVALALAWLLVKNGASAAATLFLVTLVLIGGSLQLLGQIYIMVPRLLGDARFQQAVNFLMPALRLVITLALAPFGLVSSTALFALVLSFLAPFGVLRCWVGRRIALGGPSDPAIVAELRPIVTRQLPNGIYYLFQSQLGIWLLSVFGSAETVADLGALTRISAVLGVLIATMQGIVVPRYARVQNARRLVALYLLVLAGCAALASLIVVAVWIVPEPVLWLLGSQYAHLEHELLLATEAAALSSVSILAWALSANKGWFLPVWINMPLGLTAQVSLMLAIGVSTVRQVLLMTICTEAIFLVTNIGSGLIFLRRYGRRMAGEIPTTSLLAP
ncbi:MAG TPA: hypothetical protein VJN67_09720 [Stellaceae bacterium]|nr:hypothetical protein [Stellaceae bacterium]